MTLAIVYGTRPEAIKLAPVVRELRLRGVEPLLISTGQHTTLLADAGLEPDLSLGLSSDGLVWAWVGHATDRLVAEYQEWGVSGVVVQGDTMSALAGARAARALHLPLYHIEAGLRSGDMAEPFPEEQIRVEIGSLADWHYAPTERALVNLISEGIPRERVVVTGNPVVSALAGVKPALPRAHILVTMHRREARESGAIRDAAGAALQWAASHPDVSVTWPVHPGSGLTVLSSGNFHLTPPLAYPALVDTLRTAIGVATDSGGVTEEAAVLGVPCAVMRNVTDRPESVEAGVAVLVPPGGTGMTAALNLLYTRQIARNPSDCFGKPDAAARIASHLARIIA